MPSPAEINWAIGVIRECAQLYGINDAFFVGGYPRALAMGASLSDVHDLDIGTSSPAKAIELAGFVASKVGGTVENRHRSGAVTVDMGPIEVDFQGPAAHENTLPYLHAWGMEATPLAMNIADRDFTINSLAIPINAPFKIMDLTERGLQDIDKGRIATIVSPEDIIARDPLIILRAIRFAHKYNFSIDGLLWKVMQENVDNLIKTIPEHRLLIEGQVLSKYNAGDMLKELKLDYILPQEAEQSVKVASSGISTSDYKEEIIFFPSKKKHESAYVCYLTLSLAEKSTYVVTAYLVESYLGRYAFRKDLYLSSEDLACSVFERLKTYILDIKTEFITKPHAQAELTSYFRNALKNENSDVTTNVDSVAIYLNPKNTTSNPSLGSENILSVHNTDNKIKSYISKGANS